MKPAEHRPSEAVAIVGMAGRFPGARNVAELWQNLLAGVESVRRFTAEDLAAGGLSPSLLESPNFVPAGAVLADIELFDAEFFGYSPREAETMDPQQRLFLECSWEALEDAGYDAEQYGGLIGVFGGVSENTYQVNLYTNPAILNAVDGFQLGIGNDKDFAALRTSYKLDLKGPSFTVQTTCSTSLAAVHLACQSLLTYQCDVALAGAASIGVPQAAGYVYQQGGLVSPDGHCRAFDARAAGTVAGNGVGIVVLKRLSEAVAEGDHVYAVLLGSAANNDGADKVGFTAPSVDGVRRAAALAYAFAGVDPATISYLEAHGTATPLGDPIELAGLTGAFRELTEERQFCGLGSIKTNLGHLDAAAGVAGLIKTVLALHHGEIPPSLHFEQPNPRIDFASSPFYVVSERQPWPRRQGPRRAAVNGMGFGGTNVHLVLEEAPLLPPPGPARGIELLVLSAKTEAALEAATDRLAGHLDSGKAAPLAEVAFTTQAGRRAFRHRRVLACRSHAEAVDLLRRREPLRVLSSLQSGGSPAVVFLFPGLGDHHAGMGRELYETEPTFREELDRCAEQFRSWVGFDLRRHLQLASQGREAGPEGGLDLRRMVRGRAGGAEGSLLGTLEAQPVLFAVEYALAKLWMSWGVEPEAMLGYSLGEFVAATLAGVLSLEDAARLVGERARLIESLPGGGMVAVALAEAELAPWLGGELSVSAINGHEVTVVGGPEEDLLHLETALAERGHVSRRLATSHAFHSSMLEPVAQELVDLASTLDLREPGIPYLSNVTGTWITAEEARDPRYWARHLLGTVQLSRSLAELLRQPGRVLLEVGPGRALASWALQQAAAGEEAAGSPVAIVSLPHVYEGRGDLESVVEAAGRLCLHGVRLDWRAFHGGRARQRVSLPTYPFERRRYWVDPAPGAVAGAALLRPAAGGQESRAALYLPLWRQAPPLARGGKEEEPTVTLLFAGRGPFGTALASRLSAGGARLLRVEPGAGFRRLGAGRFAVDPAVEEHYQALVESVEQEGDAVGRVVHSWSLAGARSAAEDPEPQALDRGLLSLLRVSRALDRRSRRVPLELLTVTAGTQAVTGAETLRPRAATALAAGLVVPIEYPGVSCRAVDLERSPRGAFEVGLVADLLAAEVLEGGGEPLVALRGGRRWSRHFERVGEEAKPKEWPLQRHGLYWIAGGLGGLGLLLARHLARTVEARLLLTGRSPLPPRPQWEALLATTADPALRRKLEGVREVESLGGEVLALAADVADEGAMTAALAAAEQRFGPLRGVIHAAGEVAPESFATIAQTDAGQLARHFRPRVEGTEALDRVLGDRKPDFCCLISSVSAQLGGLGYVAYAAANLFLDAFAQSRAARPGRRFRSINLDAVEVDEEAPPVGPDASPILAAGQAVELLGRALQLPNVPQVVIAAAEIEPRIRFWLQGGPAPSAAAGGASPSHRRPRSLGDYQAPRNEVEQVIAGLWELLLGVAPVGISDDFFALGGDSLLGTRLFGRLRELFRVELPLATLFSLRTVAALGEALIAHEPAPGQVQAVASLQRQVESLPDEEVRRLLHERRRSVVATQAEEGAR